ncbi:hypothetical protein V1505DRAFT_180448 [Lipomyces doorenjongii]
MHPRFCHFLFQSILPPTLILLEMQWSLQPVAGMAGGAGDIDWEDLDEDSDEEIPDLIPGDVGESSLSAVAN